jgi:hypothetical protein
MRGWGRRSSSENVAHSRNVARWRNIPITLTTCQLVKLPVFISYHVNQNPAFYYGDTMRISSGEHKGRIGAVVGINGSDSSRTYSVEFGDGTDSEIDEGLLWRDGPGLSPMSPA